MKRFLIAAGIAALIIVGCTKEEPKVLVRSKYETGYSSLAECMDSLNLKPDIVYQYRAYFGYPSKNSAQDSGTVLFSLVDTTAYNKGSNFAGKFKFTMPDFDQPVGNRNILFTPLFNSFGANVYPFDGRSGYQVIYKSDTYLWENSDNKDFKYSPDTTKLIQTNQSGSYSIFLFH